MGSRADEIEVLAIDPVDLQPVRLDVAVAVVIPFAPERVVLESHRQRVTLDRSRITSRNLAVSLPRLWASFTSWRNCAVLTGFRTDQIPRSSKRASADFRRVPLPRFAIGRF
jgi:hypothetical protein